MDSSCRLRQLLNMDVLSDGVCARRDERPSHRGNYKRGQKHLREPKHQGKNKYYSCKKRKKILQISFFFRHCNSEIFSKRVIQSGCNHARPHPHHTNINLMCHSPCRDLSRGHANQHLTQSASEADGDRRRLCRYLAINGKICPTEMWRS